MAEAAALAKTDATTSGHAFGILIRSSFPIPELPVGDGRNGFRQTRLQLEDPRRLTSEWSTRDARTLLERRFEDGQRMLVVERGEQGFHVWAPHHGRHIVAADGSRVRCAVPRVRPWRWERLLFAQVLPLASALSGRGLLHASAVSVGGGAIAFVAQSGAGKSSVAAHLVARGATLVTDDVLALSPGSRGEGVVAYPGARLAGLDPRELATMTAAGRARFGASLGTSDKSYHAVPVVDSPLPLSAVYFLERHGHGSIAIGACEALPSRLLASGFLSYLDAADHLLRHLDMCARVAATVPAYEVSAPLAAGASEVAAAVEEHALAAGHGGA